MWLLVAACELVKPFPRSQKTGHTCPRVRLERPLILVRHRKETKLSRKIVESPVTCPD